jgi:DNA-directed RNA polymerase subunit beta
MSIFSRDKNLELFFYSGTQIKKTKLQTCHILKNNLVLYPTVLVPRQKSLSSLKLSATAFVGGGKLTFGILKSWGAPPINLGGFAIAQNRFFNKTIRQQNIITAFGRKKQNQFWGGGLSPKISRINLITQAITTQQLDNILTTNITSIPKKSFSIEYSLDNFHRSNQDTCLVHKPSVFEGQWVQGGDLLADCSASVGGELALGQNILIAYLPWEGYNFEDAILVSERLVYDDLYTSVHIERYEVELRETKLGIEEITREIPDVPETNCRHLNNSGIAKLGSWVEEGDILVGKVTPVNKKAQSNYQKLLYTILDKTVLPIRDSSLRAPKGIKAKVIGIQIFKNNKNIFTSGISSLSSPKKSLVSKKAIRVASQVGMPVSTKNQTLIAKKKQNAIDFFWLHKQSLIRPGVLIDTKNTQFNALNNAARSTVFYENSKPALFNYKINQNPRQRQFFKKSLKRGDIFSSSIINFKWGARFENISFKSLNLEKNQFILDNLSLKKKTINPQINHQKNKYLNKPIKFNSSGLKGPRADIFGGQKKVIKNISSIQIYLAEKRRIQVGDKMAGRHGNKGIISQILPIEDMPFLPDGRCLDMVLNPLGVPSRMNVGQIYECLLGLAGKHLGENFKVFPFDEIYGAEASRSFVYSKLYSASLKTGKKWLFNPNSPGKIRLYDGRTGETFDQAITVGYAYILRLVHMVDDKIHARSTGPYSLVTQQPLRGRSKQGGQRLGEMEVWALEGYGAAFTLLEMLTIKSDDMTGRMTLWSNLILNKEISIGTPESFKVLICELQALCLDIGLYKANSL